MSITILARLVFFCTFFQRTAAASATHGRFGDAPIIATPCGALSGAVTALPYSGEPAFRYSSIPYAAPPTGPLRFRPPQPLACPWAGVRNGSTPSPACMQPSGSGQEDCLYLSVSMPANHSATSGPALPVLVYFHGGNLISGAAPTTPMDVLAVRTPGQVIAVSVSYRLNMLGFLATADLAAEPGWVANQGIADAIAALQWVQASIGAFGGDRSRVTIAGQSSGGTLILALFCAPSAAGLFTGALSLSGSPNITQGAAAKQAQDAPIVAALGCATPATPQLRVACLRALNASVLAQATGATAPSWGTPGIFGWRLPAGIPAPPTGQAYAGIVHVDGVLLTQPLPAALRSQLLPAAALIMSNMAAEGDGSGDPIGAGNASAAQWGGLLVQSFPAGTWGAQAGRAAAGAIGEAYRAEALVSPDLAYQSINSDYGLSCAARDIAASAMQQQRQAPLYVLYNAWQRGSWNASDGKGRWPYHGLDFDAMGWSWGASYAPTPSDFQGGAIMQQLLADFAVNRGVMPASWGWAPVSPGAPLATYVVAQESGWPGGGSRAIEGWKQRQCQVLAAHLQPMQQWWWCD